MMFPVMMKPWFAVAGLAAVGLAIWMHLYQRTASRRMPVSSLRLVPETPQVARSRRRIQHWPLFLLRALGVLLLGAAFARPGLPGGEQRPIGGRESVVFVLDRSGSMAMRDVVDELSPSMTEGRPLVALQAAAEVLARFRSDMPESLEVVGDLQCLGWEDIDTLTLPEELRVRVGQVGDPEAANRGLRRTRAWLVFFGTVALAMALAALLDRMWMFSGWARWLGWIAGLAVAAWAARRAAGPACPDASALAHRVEAEAGETAPVVATAIDPAVRQTADREELARLFWGRLDRRATAAIRLAPPTFRGRLRAPVVLAAVAAAGLAALVALQGGRGLLRMLLPWQASPYTSLALEGPAEAVAEGRAFTLTARVSGVPVEKVTLYRQDSPEPLAEAAPDEQGLVRLAVDGLDGPAALVARGGDGQSEPLRVEPYLLPGIEAFEIEVTPPGYASHAADTETAPSFSAFRGSRLRYRIRLKAPAVSVAVQRSARPRKEERVTDEERATLERGPYGVLVGAEEPDAEQPDLPVFRPDPADPRVWESDWELPDPEDIVYRLAIEGEHGDNVRNDEPWRINVLWDAPPKVRIHGHNGGEVIRVGNETVRIDLSAVDDVRLAGARLVYRKPGRPHAWWEIELPPDTRRTWSGAELLALAPLDLGPLDIVAVHAEAEDANSLDGPGVGRSEVVFLEVPLPESDDGGGGSGGGGGGGLGGSGGVVGGLAQGAGVDGFGRPAA